MATTLKTNSIARQRIVEADIDLASVTKDLDRLSKATPEILQRATIDAARDMQRHVVRAIRINLANSGIQSRTGKLLQSVSSVTCEGVYRPSGPALQIRMPASGSYQYGGENRTPVKGKGTESPRVWASLNYGAVRAGTETRRAVSSIRGSTIAAGKEKRMALLGAKAKRSVKDYALGGSLSERQIARIEQDVRIGGETQRKAFAIGVKTREDSKSVGLSGGAVVIKPKPFFSLTAAQKKELGDRFASLFIKYLSALL